MKLKVWLPIGILSLAAILAGAAWYLFYKDSPSQDNTPEYFHGYQSQSGVPSRTDISTDIPGVSVAWQDQRVVDGNFSCTVYNYSTQRILAVYSKSSGFNPDGKVSSGTTYKDTTISQAKIDATIQTYCK